MAAKSTILDTNYLKLVFQAVGITGVADNTATSPLTSLYVSLHTASPGAAGAQNTSEAAYTGYSRVAVARSTSGWSAASGSCSPVSAVTFPAATGGTETETYFGVGTAASGAGTLLYFGPISPSISVASGVTPILTTATAITEQ